MTLPSPADRSEFPDLALICGYGSLPLEIAREAAKSGRRPLMIGIKGEASPEIVRYPSEFLHWGQVGKLFSILRSFGIRDLVFAGGIKIRPDPWKMLWQRQLDLGALAILPQALAFIIGGDNTVLSGTIKMLERKGIRVLGAHEVAPSLLAESGLIAGPRPSKADLANIRLGFSACKALGAFDIGQASVAEANRVVALEGAEGTDGLLARIVSMRETGRMPKTGKNGVLVKTMKPGQDMRADLPAIGPATVTGAVAAGLRGIALEAGHAIILEREQTIAEAKKAGIYILGYAPEAGK